MAHIIQDNKILNLSIYVILFEEEKRFLVGKTEPEKMKQVYKYHYYCGSSKTKHLFQSARNNGLVPPMYCLEYLKTTQRDAFFHCVAWVRFFLEHGYLSCCEETLNSYAEEMRTDCRLIYESINTISIDEICPTGGDLFPAFGQRKVKPKSQDRRIINFRVNATECEQLLAAAEKSALSVSRYCRKMALTGRVIFVDDNTFRNLTASVQELVRRDNLLRNILTAIYSTNRYYPADLEIIQKAIDDNAEQQRAIIQEIRDFLREIRKK